MKRSGPSTFAERSARACERRLARQPSLRAAGGLPRQTPECIRKHLKERGIYKPWVDRSRPAAQALLGVSKVSKFHFDPEADSDTELVIVDGPSTENGSETEMVITGGSPRRSDNMPSTPKVEAKLQSEDEHPVQASESLSRGDKINFINHCFRHRGRYLATVTNSEKITKAKEAEFWQDMRATSMLPFQEGTYTTATKVRKIVTGTCPKRRKASITASSRLPVIAHHADLQHAMDLWIPIWKLRDTLSHMAKTQALVLQILGQAEVEHHTGKSVGTADGPFTPIIFMPEVQKAVENYVESLKRRWEGTPGEAMYPAEVELWPSQVSTEVDIGDITTDDDESDEEDQNAIPSVEKIPPPANDPATVAKLKQFEAALIQQLRNGKKANAVTGYVSPPSTSSGDPQATNPPSIRSQDSAVESSRHQDGPGAIRLRPCAEINANAEASGTRGRANPKDSPTNDELPSLRKAGFEERRSAIIARNEKTTGVSMILAAKPPTKPRRPRGSKPESRSDAPPPAKRHMTRTGSRVGRGQNTSHARAEMNGASVAGKSIASLDNQEETKSEFPKGGKGKRKWQEQPGRELQNQGPALMNADAEECQRRKKSKTRETFAPDPQLGERGLPTPGQAPPSKLPQDKGHAAQRLESKKTPTAPKPSISAASSGKPAPSSVLINSQTSNGATTITTDNARSASPVRLIREIPKTSSSAATGLPSDGDLGRRNLGEPHLPMAGLGNLRYDGASADKSKRKGHGEGGNVAPRDGPLATAPAPPERRTHHAIHIDTAGPPNRGLHSTHDCARTGCVATNSSQAQPYFPRPSAPSPFRPHIRQGHWHIHTDRNGEPVQPSRHRQEWEHKSSLVSHSPRHEATARITKAPGGDREVATMTQTPQGLHIHFDENGEPGPRGLGGKPMNRGWYSQTPSRQQDGAMRHPATWGNDISPPSEKSAGDDRSLIHCDRSHSVGGSHQGFGAAGPSSVASSSASSRLFVRTPQWPSHDFLLERHISSEGPSTPPLKSEHSAAPEPPVPDRFIRAEEGSGLFLPEANPKAGDTEMVEGVEVELTPAQLERLRYKDMSTRKRARIRAGEKPTQPCGHCRGDHWTQTCPMRKSEKNAERKKRKAAKKAEARNAAPPKAPAALAGKRKAGEIQGSRMTAQKGTKSQSVQPTKRARHGAPIAEYHSPAWHAGYPFHIKPSPLKRDFADGRYRPPRWSVKQAQAPSQAVTAPGPSYSRPDSSYSRSDSVATERVKDWSPETQAKLWNHKYNKAKQQFQSASVENANLKEENERLRRHGAGGPRGHSRQN